VILIDMNDEIKHYYPSITFSFTHASK